MSEGLVIRLLLVGLFSGLGAYGFACGALQAHEWNKNPISWTRNRRGMLGIFAVYFILIAGLSATVIGLIGYLIGGGNAYHFSSRWPYLLIACLFYFCSSCGVIVALVRKRRQHFGKQRSQNPEMAQINALSA